MTPNEYEAVITLRDLHDDIKAIRNDLTTVITQLSATTVTTADHETRIRALERRVWTAAGVAAVFSALVPQLAPLVSTLGS